MVQEDSRAASGPSGTPARPVSATDQWATAPVEPTIVSEGAPTVAKPPVNTGRAVREVIETLLLAAVIFLLVRLVVLNFRVDGESMTPNLQNEQMLLVNVNAYRHFDLNNLFNLIPGQDRDGAWMVWPFGQPERGDIIVFNPTADAEQPYIKRVIGLPGERITFQDGYVYVNGQRLDETYIDGPATRCRQSDECDVVVEPDHVFVLGDNRTNSTDSRVIGQVPLSNIVGKAWLSYWPLDLFGFVPHYDYPSQVEESIGTGSSTRLTAPAAQTETLEERRERLNKVRESRGVPTLAPAG
jgi:signal peptidase I